MLKFEKKPLEAKPNKTFKELECGNCFVWANKDDCLCIKLSEGCYWEVSSGIVYSVAHFIEFSTFYELDIVEDEYRCDYDAILEVEYEINEPVRWSVVR